MPLAARILLCFLCACMAALAVPASAAEAAPVAAVASDNSADLVVFNRRLVTFRAPFLGNSPAVRAARARATLDAELEDQPAIFLSALRHFLTGGTKLPPALRGQPPAVIEELRRAFHASTLRMLVA